MQKRLTLNYQSHLEITPTSPFHFNSTFFKPAHFPTADTKWLSSCRWQTMVWQSNKLGLIFSDSGTEKRPKVAVKIFSGAELSESFLESLKNEIIWRYNLNLDLTKFYHNVSRCKVLKPAIQRFRGLRPMHAGSLYEYLIIAVVLQNATVHRSVQMMQNLFENYGTKVEFAGEKLFCFWEPSVLAGTKEDDLRKLKMGYRAKSLIKVSEPFVDDRINELTLRQTDINNQEETLISLYGIGPASVGYIMFDVFHRWNYLKHISPWEQKIYTHIFFNKDHEKELVAVSDMLKYFNRFGKWKNLAIHYVWEDIWWKRRNKNIP